MAIEQAVTHDVRVVAMREAIDQVDVAINVLRVATHRLIDADLHGAVDVASQVLYQANRGRETLEKQFADLVTLDDKSVVLVPHRFHATRHPRRKGIDIIPGRVKQARLEAGLSLGQVARKDITRAAISLIESGKTRPSQLTLDLIARRTGKPIEFFTEVAIG